MKITLKELRKMIQESVVRALKEQGPPNPLIDPWAAAQGVPARPPMQRTGSVSQPSRTQASTPSRTSQTPTAITLIRELIYSLGYTVRTARTAQRTIDLEALNSNLDKMKNPNVESILSGLPRNTDILMVNKQNEARQAADLLRRVLRARVDQNNAPQVINSIRTVLRNLRDINQALGSQDSQADQIISQLATLPDNPQVSSNAANSRFAERPGQAPGPLAGSQTVPIGYRPEGTPPQERPVTASAMQEKRNKKR